MSCRLISLPIFVWNRKDLTQLPEQASSKTPAVWRFVFFKAFLERFDLRQPFELR